MSSPGTHHFQLIESLRYSPQEGFFLLQRHLDRLQQSAAQLGFTCNIADIVGALNEAVRVIHQLSKVRLELARDGQATVDSQPLYEEPTGRFAVASQAVDSTDWSLAHKTTQRAVYDNACAGLAADVTDVVLWNERGELTETCRGNLVAYDGESWLTPPLNSGLLAGTFRAQLLSEGRLRERLLMLNDIRSWQALYRINSVRLWTRIDLVS